MCCPRIGAFLAHLSSSRHLLGLAMVVRVSVYDWSMAILLSLMCFGQTQQPAAQDSLSTVHGTSALLFQGTALGQTLDSYPWLLRHCSPVALRPVKQELMELANASQHFNVVTFIMLLNLKINVFSTLQFLCSLSFSCLIMSNAQNTDQNFLQWSLIKPQ